MFTALPSLTKLFNLLEKPIKLLKSNDFHFVSQCWLLLITFSSFMYLEMVSITFQRLRRTGLAWVSLINFSLPSWKPFLSASPQKMSHLPSKVNQEWSFNISMFPHHLWVQTVRSHRLLHVQFVCFLKSSLLKFSSWSKKPMIPECWFYQ